MQPKQCGVFAGALRYSLYTWWQTLIIQLIMWMTVVVQISIKTSNLRTGVRSKTLRKPFLAPEIMMVCESLCSHSARCVDSCVAAVRAKKPCQGKSTPIMRPPSTDEMSGSVESKAKNA